MGVRKLSVIMVIYDLIAALD